MILVDFSGIAIATIAVNKVNDESMLRHMILNSLRMYNKKFKDKYGQMVLACDSSSWRRDYFPQYKANRRSGRDESDFDWAEAFRIMHQVKDEIKENFPYKVIHIDKCEADDIIAVLSKHIQEDILIISGDKDFQQLQSLDNVIQWSPNLNKEVVCQDPSLFLKEHILTGDKSDGIPNILSSDDCMVEGIRQTPLRKPIKDKYLRISIENDDKYYRNYLRNQTLIDFDFIPKDIEDSIISEFANTRPVKGKVFDYLRTHRLNELLDNVGDFSL